MTNLYSSHINHVWRLLVFHCLYIIITLHHSPSSSSLLTAAHVAAATHTIEPTWESLDQRPLPLWYDEAKFGIFIHWGVFSVPSIVSEWFQSYWTDRWSSDHAQAIHDFVSRNERLRFAYTEYAARFTADLYRPDEWMDYLARAGAQYVVFTSKHHDGFCNWNTSRIPGTTYGWNSVDVGPRRDLVGDFAAAVHQTTSPYTQRPLQLGIYHSLYEWYNPLYLHDKRNGHMTRDFVTLKTGAELYDLVRRYEPTLLWSDGEWEAPSAYWQATDFLAWYATNSTVATQAVWNDRWGSDTLCKHGGFLTCTDRYDPGVYRPVKWENALTIDKSSWSYNRNSTISDYMTVLEIVHELIQVVAYNGNLLLNIGPSADGTIDPIFIDRLLGVGAWLAVNGEAIYGTRPWLVCQDEHDNATITTASKTATTTTTTTTTKKTARTESSTTKRVYYTRKGDTLYVHMTQWPSQSVLHLSCPVTSSNTRVSMLGVSSDPDGLQWSGDAFAGMNIELPLLTPDLIPCQHAWVLAISGVLNL
jgi:alpha-L-fucosidase